MLMASTTYISEDILEIVRIAEDTVYFRASLVFFNGHSCGEHGIARFSQASVSVFNDPQKFTGDAVCRLQFDISDKAITIKDPDGSCRNYCGARDSCNDETFLRSARRTIRYMTILKNSEQYKEALGTLDNSWCFVQVNPKKARFLAVKYTPTISCRRDTQRFRCRI